MTVGDTLTVGTGGRKELVKVASVGSTGASGTGVNLAAPLQFDHMPGVDVSDVGTGISFSPATTFRARQRRRGAGAGQRHHARPASGQRACVRRGPWSTPWPRWPVTRDRRRPISGSEALLSTRAGSIALTDASGVVVVDAIVYGSQQSNSSAQRDHRQSRDRDSRG